MTTVQDLYSHRELHADSLFGLHNAPKCLHFLHTDLICGGKHTPDSDTGHWTRHRLHALLAYSLIGCMHCLSRATRYCIADYIIAFNGNLGGDQLSWYSEAITKLSYHMHMSNIIKLMLFIEEGIHGMHNTVPYIHTCTGTMSTYNSSVWGSLGLIQNAVPHYSFLTPD